MKRNSLSFSTRIVAHLAIIAFVFNVLLPFFAVYDVTAAEAAGAERSLFGEKILICTAEGFKLISVDQLAEGEDIPASHSDYECALCYVSAHQKADGTLTFLGFLADASHAGQSWQGSAPAHLHDLASHVQAPIRAPPVA